MKLIEMFFLVLFAVYMSQPLFAADKDQLRSSTICALHINSQCEYVVNLTDIKDCPKDEFDYDGAINFVVSAWPKTGTKKEIDTFKTVISQLIKKGCDINKVNDRGFVALHTAVLRANREAIVFLLDNGADPTLKISSPKERTRTQSFVGLDTFDLISKNHSKDYSFDGHIYGDTAIYLDVRDRYPQKLKPLPQKISVPNLNYHEDTPFGKVKINVAELDDQLLIYDVLPHQTLSAKENNEERVYFEWLAKNKIFKEFCKNDYKVINKTSFIDSGMKRIKSVLSCE